MARSHGAGPVAESGTIGNERLAVGSLLDRPVPDFTLLDERGRATNLASFRGRYLIFAPAMTLCHEVCPMTAAALERIQATLKRIGVASDATVAEISVDPWRDTPRRLRAYQRLARLHFRMLTASHEQLRRLWRFFGVYFRRVAQGTPPDTDWLTHKPETMDVQHSDGFFILDPVGHWRVAAAGMPSVSRLTPALRGLLNDQGNSNLRHPQSPWTPAQVVDDLVTLRQGEDAQSSGRADSPHALTPAQVRVALRGSAAPLAALHRQGAQIVGGAEQFRKRLAALSGRPVVVNEWASWCVPCRTEFPLFASAAAHFGRRVAFLGLNVSDQSGSARQFLRDHPVSYPSYFDPAGSVAASFGSAAALPTTLFFAADGRRVATHIGQYTALEALDSDIERDNLGQ